MTIARMTGIALLTFVLAPPSMQAAERPLSVFEDRCLELRSVHLRLQAARAEFNQEEIPAAATAGLRKMDHFAILRRDLGGDFFSYFRALLMNLAGTEKAEYDIWGRRVITEQWQQVLRQFNNLTRSRFVGPEALMILSEQLSKTDYECSSFCLQQIEALVPIVSRYITGSAKQ